MFLVSLHVCFLYGNVLMFSKSQLFPGRRGSSFHIIKGASCIHSSIKSGVADMFIELGTVRNY